jgi:hypothetical protein
MYEAGLRAAREIHRTSRHFRPEQRQPTKLREDGSAIRAQKARGEIAERRKSAGQQVTHEVAKVTGSRPNANS